MSRYLNVNGWGFNRQSIDIPTLSDYVTNILTLFHQFVCYGRNEYSNNWYVKH